jgi:hypothetical protein
MKVIFAPLDGAMVEHNLHPLDVEGLKDNSRIAELTGIEGLDEKACSMNERR